VWEVPEIRSEEWRFHRKRRGKTGKRVELTSASRIAIRPGERGYKTGFKETQVKGWNKPNDSREDSQADAPERSVECKKGEGLKFSADGLTSRED